VPWKILIVVAPEVPSAAILIFAVLAAAIVVAVNETARAPPTVFVAVPASPNSKPGPSIVAVIACPTKATFEASLSVIQIFALITPRARDEAVTAGDASTVAQVWPAPMYTVEYPVEAPEAVAVHTIVMVAAVEGTPVPRLIFVIVMVCVPTVDDVASKVI
jgi:hypothetical protein